MASYSEKLNDIFKRADILIVSSKPKPSEVRPPLLYNIHKRSLPVGIDAPVVFGVDKDKAEKLVTNVLKSRIVVHPTQSEEKDYRTIIYYDIVPQGASPRERSVYFNKGPVALQ